jgi:diguanylate cyclase (GGDEF)-like protein
MISIAHVRVACLWTIAALCPLANAWAQRSTFRQYGSAEGLSNLAINCLLQDRTGYLWVGTDNGLFRYDGGEFTHFGREEGLPNTEIRSLAESSEGVLWVATQSGLARQAGTQFKPVDVGEQGEVHAVLFDRLGRMYLNHLSGILLGIPDGTGSYRFSKVVSGAIGGLWASGTDVWFGKDGDVWRLKGGKAEPVGRSAGLPVDDWGAFAADSLGNLWVRSAIHLYERVRGQPLFVNRSAGIPQASSSYLYADGHGRLYVSSDSGVVILEGANRTVIDSGHGLPAEAAGPVLMDREESLWLGTFGGGLARRLGHGEWLSWKKEDGLVDNATWATLLDRAGRVWVGTSGGLSILGRDDRTMRPWARHIELVGGRILAVVESPGGDIFVGTHTGGISRFSKGGVLLQTYEAASGLGTTHVAQIAFDRQGRLWAVGAGGCFRSRAPLNAAGELRFERVDVPGIPALARFRDLLVDEGGGVWIATSAGLARFDGSRWRVFTEGDGLKSGTLNAITWGNGAIWFSYRDALGITCLRLDGERAQTNHFTQRDGLSSDMVYALAFDQDGQLWASTDNGVNVLARGHWRHYGTEDGLIWDDGDDRALYVDRENSVWVGTSQGLSRFASPHYPIPDAPPPAVLTSITGGAQEFRAQDRPVLPHEQSSLLFRFSALSYSSGTRTRFRYRLQGYESGWNETRQRDVHYAGLPAGQYVFEVIAAGTNGAWSPVPAQFAFSVRPPWWRSWWFLASCLVAALLLMRALWWFRVRALLAQKEALERQVAERTAELVESHRHLEEIAYHDVLTSLPNRRMFTEQFRKQLAQARRHGESFGLLLIDLDHFKRINDEFGHDAGDVTLIETAKWLRAAVRETDCAARLGGDEFGIVVVSARDKAGIEVVCRRIVESFAVGIPFKDANLAARCSIGAALYPDDGNTEASLYKVADLALYDAKRTGPNVFCWHRSETNNQSLSVPAKEVIC